MFSCSLRDMVLTTVQLWSGGGASGQIIEARKQDRGSEVGNRGRVKDTAQTFITPRDQHFLPEAASPPPPTTPSTSVLPTGAHFLNGPLFLNSTILRTRPLTHERLLILRFVSQDSWQVPESMGQTTLCVLYVFPVHTYSW